MSAEFENIKPAKPVSWHKTFIKFGEPVTLKKCESDVCTCTSQFHCPFCELKHFPADLSVTVQKHLEQFHWPSGVQYKDLFIVRCRLSCGGDPDGHYHCPCCYDLTDDRHQLVTHLQAHLADQGESMKLAYAPDSNQPEYMVYEDFTLTLCKVQCHNNRLTSVQHYHCPGCGYIGWSSPEMIDHMAGCVQLSVQKPCTLFGYYRQGTLEDPRIAFKKHWHGSIVRDKLDIPISRCTTGCCNRSYHCPLCTRKKTKPNTLHNIRKHFSYHLDNAVIHKGYIFLACLLDCVTGGEIHRRKHYHCPYCGKGVSARLAFLAHLKPCSERPDQDVMEVDRDKEAEGVGEDSPGDTWDNDNDYDNNDDDDNYNDYDNNDNEDDNDYDNSVVEAVHTKPKISKQEIEMFDSVFATVASPFMKLFNFDSADAARKMLTGVAGATSVEICSSPGTDPKHPSFGIKGSLDSVLKAESCLHDKFKEVNDSKSVVLKTSVACQEAVKEPPLMCSVAVQTTMAAPVLCQHSGDRSNKDITIKTPTDHEYSKTTFCGQPDLGHQKTGASKANQRRAKQLGQVQVAANLHYKEGGQLTSVPYKEGGHLTYVPYKEGGQLTSVPYKEGGQLTSVPYKEGGQLTSAKDSHVQLVDNSNKRSVEQMAPPKTVSKASAESRTLQGGIVNPSVVQASHDVVVRTASSTSGLTHELIQKESKASQELAGQQHFVALPSMTAPQTGKVASENTKQVIPIKFVPVVAQDLVREQGEETMVKSSEEVPADNATTKPASISTASVGMSTAIGHLLQGHTSNIRMNQQEFTEDNQVVVCAARADIHTKSAGQSVVQKPLRDSRVPYCPKEVQPSPLRIPRITDPCSVDNTSKDAVPFPRHGRHQEDGKSGKCSQSDTIQIPTPSATEKVILLKFTPQAGKGRGDEECSSIKYLAVPTKKSGLNAEQANLSEGKGTDCSGTASILNGNPSLITPSSSGRGTKRQIEKFSQESISQKNVSTQTVIWIKKPSKSLSKQNSPTSDALATADTPSSQRQSIPCPDIDALKRPPPSNKAQPQPPRKANISMARNSLAVMLKGQVRYPLQMNPIIKACVSDQYEPKESLQSTATNADVPTQKLPKQGIPVQIIHSHNIFRITGDLNRSLLAKQNVTNPPKGERNCPVVLKSEPALQLNEFLEKQSCYVPKVQSGGSIGELVDREDIRGREIRWTRPGLCGSKRKPKPTLKSSVLEVTESKSTHSKTGNPSQLWKDSDPVLNEVETLKAERNIDAIEVASDGQRLILKQDLLCMICSQQFENSEGLAAHVMASHFKFKCQFCLTIFTKADLYVQHMKGSRCLQKDARLYETVFRCGDCWDGYATRAALDKHQLRQHGTAIRCSICEKTFPTFGTLRDHLIRDHGENSWVCDLCGKSFLLEKFMLKHRKRHGMEKTFLCPTCGKCLKDASSLKIHVDIHKPEGERQYRFMCSYCGRRFNNKLYFGDHVNTHTGKTPYACKSCDKTFFRLASMKKHEILRHSDKKPFVCEICSKAFKLKPRLKAHMVTHTGVSKYKCTYCQRSFGNNGILKAHVERCKKKHPTQVKEAQGGSGAEEASIVVEQLNEFGENSNLCEVISASRVDEAEVDTDINRTLSEPFVYMCTACNHQFDDMITADMHIKLCSVTGI